jgi:lysophospholipase L1-like esterase
VKKWSSSKAWTIAGVAAVAVSILLLCTAFGVSITRKEPPISAAPSALAIEAPKKVVVVGDSLTAGSAEGGVGPNGWTELAWRQLRIEGVDVAPEVSGRGGSGYAKHGAAGTTFVGEEARLVRPDDDVIVFFGGSNDFGEPVDDVSSAIHETLTAARATAPDAKIVVVGPIWPVKVQETPDIAFVFENLLRIRDTLRDDAATIGAIFVDPIADRWFFDAPASIGRDNVHPTDAGHKYMYERLMPVLRAALAPKPAQP